MEGAHVFSGIAWSGRNSLLPKHQHLGIFLHVPLVQEVVVKLPKARFGCYNFLLDFLLSAQGIGKLCC